MIAHIELHNSVVKIDFSNPISIGISLEEKSQPKCFYAPDFKIQAVEMEDFIGDTSKGGIVNFKNVFINPHGNGTHTECVGHIASEAFFIKDTLRQFMFPCTVISVEATVDKNGISSITKETLSKALDNKSHIALAIRTLPNSIDKTTCDYSHTNPTFIATEAMEYINSLGVEHLLVDLPSVDPEFDDGKLAAHRIFWKYPADIQIQKTITELIYIPNEVCDGDYILQFQILNIALDASPSYPVLYKKLN